MFQAVLGQIEITVGRSKARCNSKVQAGSTRQKRSQPKVHQGVVRGNLAAWSDKRTGHQEFKQISVEDKHLRSFWGGA